MNNIVWWLSPEHFMEGLHPIGFLVHGLVALISLVLFIWWTRKDTLLSFRAWAFFMTIVHILYFFLTSDHFRAFFGLTMADIFFLRGLEAIVTIFTMLRLYFIIEAYGIDLSEKNADNGGPMGVIAGSIKKAIIAPINPKEINGNAKKTAKNTRNLREKLIDLLF